MSEEKLVEEAVELAKEAKSPSTFNIINVLQERAFPVEHVNVYLNEQLAYDASKVQDKISEANKGITEEDLAISDELVKERDAIIAELEKSRYVFHLTGISEGTRNKIQEDCLEKFPMEYEESKNPFTGEIVKQEIESKSRDRYFTNSLWVASITKIVSPDGSEQGSLSISEVEKLRDMLPLAASGAITQSIEKLRISTAVFMASVDEDFLAKS